MSIAPDLLIGRRRTGEIGGTATTDRKFRVSFGPARILDAGRHDTETRPATGCFVTRLVRHPG